MDNQMLVSRLNAAIELEHAAIIQYLNHAFALGEGELACEIEAISRDEMRHFDWLAETITARGGDISLARATVLVGENPVMWMKDDVRAEEEAIAMYRGLIADTDDPDVKLLLERILHDELNHRRQFAHFVEKVTRERMVDKRGSQCDEALQTVNWGIEHEYTVILQYMAQSYYARNAEAKKQFEDQGINEMQHMGWLAEEMIGKKGRPELQHAPVEAAGRDTPLREMLKADIQIEDYVAGRYDETSQKATDPGTKALFERLRDHERYHSRIFGKILNEAAAENTNPQI